MYYIAADDSVSCSYRATLSCVCGTFSFPFPNRLSRTSAPSPSFSKRPEAKRTDEEARKKVADQLLEKASQRVAAAKDVSKVSEASTRREVETIPKVGGVAVDVKPR